MNQLEDTKFRFEQALKIYESLLKKDPGNAKYQLETARTLNNLGTIFHHMGKLGDAKLKHESALEIYTALLNKKPENEQYQLSAATTQIKIGTILQDIGKPEEAKFWFEQALNIYKKLLNRSKELLSKDAQNVQYQSNMAGMQNNLGLLLRDMGKLEEAKFWFEQALKIREIMLNNDPKNAEYQSWVATTRNSLGNLLINMNKLEEAKFRFEQILKIRVALLNKNAENTKYQSDIAETQNNLGTVLSNMGKLEEAKFRFEQALNIYETLLNKDSENGQYQSNMAAAYNNLGLVLRDMGLNEKDSTKFKEAKFRFEQALNIYETLLNKDSENGQYQSDMAAAHNNLGMVLQNMGLNEEDSTKLKEAKFRFEQALEMREMLLKKDSENAEYKFYVAESLLNLGGAMLFDNSSSKSLDYFSEALNLVSISGRPDLVFRIFGVRGKYYEKIGNFDQAYEDYRESIERIELIRSQFSLEEYKLDILRNKVGAYSEMISFLCVKKNDAGKAWEYVERAKSRSLLDYLRFVELPVPPNIPKDLQSKERELIESIRICDRKARTTEKADQASLLSQEITKLQTELDKLYNQINDFAPVYVDLRKGRPLLIKEIIDLLKNQSKKTAFIEYYTTPEKVFIFTIHSNSDKPKVKIVDLPSLQLTDYVIRYFQEIVNYQPGIEETWLEVAEYIIIPIFEDIKGCEILYLIPHGLLHYLPLHALSINGKRLIEHFSIVYAPSLTAMSYVQRKISEKLDSCISMGFTPKENERELFEKEASLIANLFHTKPYLGTDVNKQLLTNIDIDVIHLSCHGVFDSQDPLNSGLLLSDGIFTVRDIFGTNIKVNLLVLSACQTGLNEQKPGDELIGLTRAFLYSGVKSVIVSLWSVSDISTLKLMESFYKKINEKMSKAEALQKAQTEMIHDKEYFHPYYWAPFILIGD